MSAIPASRLIERDLLHLEASVAGLKERYARGETQQTIHVWWARRPHAAMRALVLFSLLRNDAEISLAEAFTDDGVRRIRALLHASHGRKPRVLDPFGGGGTIPFEAAYLGAETFSADSNALAAFIQAANLSFSAELKKPITLPLLAESGAKVLAKVAAATEKLFPRRRGGAGNYIWSYRRRCAACAKAFSVSKRPWLSTKGPRKIFHQLGEREVTIRTTGKPAPSNWVARTSRARCPHCSELNAIELGGVTDALCCTVLAGEPRGKVFSPPSPREVPAVKTLRAFERKILARLRATLPETALPKWSGIINPALYGMRTHADHFNPRQRCVMLALIEALGAQHREIEIAHGADTARFITCALSGLIDQLVDWNSRLSMWIPQNEQAGRALCGPGVAMLWDYTETDPVGGGPSNLHAKLQRIVRGAAALTALPSTVNVSIASATALPFSNEMFDAIITDPPYYDNVFYAPLADFIYPWKKMALGKITPEFFRSEVTDGENELVSSALRAGSSAKAHARYCAMLTRALQEAGRVLRRDGVLALVYSHSSVKGWCALVQAFQASGFTVQGAQPLAIERRARPRAVASTAVNTCVVFIANLNSAKTTATRGDAKQLLQTKPHEEFLGELKQLGWADADAGVALLARMLAPLCNVRTSPAALEELIAHAGELASGLCPGFRLVTRRSL